MAVLCVGAAGKQSREAGSRGTVGEERQSAPGRVCSHGHFTPSTSQRPGFVPQGGAAKPRRWALLQGEAQGDNLSNFLTQRVGTTDPALSSLPKQF